MPKHAVTTIRMFGGLEVQIGTERLGTTRTKKERMLLAYLVLQRGRPVSRDALAVALWPDSTSSQRLSNLRRSLMNLRKALGAEKGRISSDTHSIRFDTTGAVVDVLDFDLLAVAQDAEKLRSAIELYRGPLLPDFDSDWVVAERLSRVNACEAAIRKLVQFLPPPEAIHYLRLGLSIDPMNESSLRDLMSLLAQSGDQVGGLEAYQAFETRVRRQYGWRVSPETAALHDRIQGTVPTSKSTGTQMGPIAEGKALAQSFIGRREELDTLTGLIGFSRLVTLFGPTGIGKTRLASELVSRIQPRFRDGSLSVVLKPEANTESLFELLCQEWGLGESEFPDASVVQFLQGKELLLWIDGIQLVSTRLSEDLSRLREIGPGLHLLLTSWQTTELPGERTLALRPLPFQVPVTLDSRFALRHSFDHPEISGLQTAGGKLQTPQNALDASPSESALLFAERARRMRPGFQLDNSNLGEVEGLCRDLEGLPLAVEIAAAWMGTMNLKDIRALFSERADVDDAFALDPSESRPSLRSALDSSLEALTDEEGHLLDIVTSFPDGCTLQAIQRIEGLQVIAIARSLHRVVSLSLVSFEPESGRYRMLRVVREHFLSKQSDESKERYRSAAAAYLWKLIEDGLADGDTLFNEYADEWLLAERENFRYFVDWWKSRDPFRSVVAEFAMVAYQVWPAADVRIWLRRFSHPSDFPPGSEPFVRYVIAIFSLWQRHPDRRQLLEEALACARQQGTPLWEATCLTGLSVLAQDAGDTTEISRLESQVQAAAKRAGTIYYPEHSLGVQAYFEYLGGRVDAQKALRQQLARGDLANDWRIRYASLRCFASIAVLHRDFQALASWSDEAARIASEHSQHELSYILSWQSLAALECDDFAAARDWAAKALAVTRKRKTYDREARAILLFASIAERESALAEADRHVAHAGQIYESISEYRQFCICLIRRAGYAEKRNRKDDVFRLAHWANALRETHEFTLEPTHQTTLAALLASSDYGAQTPVGGE